MVNAENDGFLIQQSRRPGELGTSEECAFQYKRFKSLLQGQGHIPALPNHKEGQGFFNSTQRNAIARTVKQRQRESQHPLQRVCDRHEPPACGELHLPRERLKQCQGLGRAKKVG